MKKVWVILTVMISVFAFVAAATADDVYNRSTGAWNKCSKCPIGRVPCPGIQIIPGAQGTHTTANEPAYPFDFDGNAYLAPNPDPTIPYNPPAANIQQRGFGSWGYAAGDNYGDDAERNCKFFFDLCECDDACNLVPGKKMGVEMYIKTPGVYFADPVLIEAGDDYGVVGSAGKPTIHFNIERTWNATAGEPCHIDSMAHPTVLQLEEAPYYLSAVDGSRLPGGSAEVPTGSIIRNFGPIEYYTGFSEGDNAKGKFESKPAHQYSNEAPLSGAYQGTVPARNRVVALQSFVDTDYMLTEYDAIGECKLWIDIPAMRIDPTVAQEGAMIQLQVRLLFNREKDVVCPECNPASVCDVTFDVGIVCADAIAPEDSEYCMFFPYVLQGLLESDGWSTGIAISSRDDEMPDEAWVELTLKDRAGNSATYKRDSLGKGLVWSFVLDSQMENFTGTLVPGATSLTVKSNYSMDGYQFLNVAGTFGAGSNARGCKPGQCCPQ